MASERIKYADLVDVAKLQQLMESFSATLGIANAVIDTEGVVITSAGWQDVCTGFHRVNTETCARCIESDTSLVTSMTHGDPYAIYRCLNGLVDTAAPIVVNGEHVANVFTGQFFTAPPDREFFVQQARRFGFDEDAYLAAVARVPVIPKERAESITRLYAQLAGLLADSGLDRLQLAQTADELTRTNKLLEDMVGDRTRELTRAYETVHSQEGLLRQILETSTVGIFLIDVEARITHVNRCFCEMFACPAADALGRCYLDFLQPGDRDSARTRIRSGFEGALTRVESERRYVRADGTEFWGHLTGTRFLDADGRCESLLGVVADITERKEAELKLRDFNAELEKRVRERTAELETANRDLESFSYSVSHDLRAPLRAINGFSRILAVEEGERLSPEGRDMLSRIARAATHLDDLIDDVLDYSRAGRLVLTEETIDLDVLVRKAAAELNETYPAAEIRIGVLPSVKGDSTMLRQVALNLLGNACKYSSKRERPLIEVAARESPEGWEVGVTDNGAGFDMRYADKMFGMFQRFHPESEFEGTGVGLAIVKRLVERLGGRVRGEGVVDGGASFYFTLPHRSVA